MMKLALSVGFCSALAGHAQDVVNVSTNYYSVSAGSVRDLRGALNASRPWKTHGSMDARTQWNVQWSYGLSAPQDSCRLDFLSTRTTITITLPRLVPGIEPSPTLKERWEKYLAALREHEGGHLQIARAAGGEVQARVRALGPGSSCVALKQSIEKTASQVVAEKRAQEDDYDRMSEHGAKQGARFP